MKKHYEKDAYKAEKKWNKCAVLPEEDKKRFGNASFDNTMGGSMKFMERRGHYQSEFGFDSL